jgi:hypothetical protein
MVLDSLLALLYNLSIVVLVVVTICELYRAAANKQLKQLDDHLEHKLKRLNYDISVEIDDRTFAVNRLQDQITDLDKEVGSIAALLHEMFDEPVMDEEDELDELFAANLAAKPSKKAKPKSSKPAKKPVSKSKAKK